MDQFIVDAETRNNLNGDHEVHNVSVGCIHLPPADHWVDLGEHPNSFSAVVAAKKIYSNTIGCHLCCPDSRLD